MLTGPPEIRDLADWCAERLRARGPLVRAHFAIEAMRLAETARAMAARFTRGGRILAFGRGPYATDAQHVAVEFVHPVLVGKRALPALDVSLDPKTWVEALARPEDIVIAFGPPDGDQEILAVLESAAARGAYTIALPGRNADYALVPPVEDAHIFQELVEITGHVIYESVQVFLEHRSGTHDLGGAAFLYPYLTGSAQDQDRVQSDVATSIVAKAEDAAALREQLADEASATIAETIAFLDDALAKGATLMLFGNGGSATDATDFALDLATRGDGLAPVRAISLALEPAMLTAIVNDVGREVVFSRQVIAQSKPGDVAIALSTSGGSVGVIAGLVEARKRGMGTVALLGYDGGEILRRGLADHTIVVRCDYIPRIQEAQAAVYHTIRAGLAYLHNDR